MTALVTVSVAEEGCRVSLGGAEERPSLPTSSAAKVELLACSPHVSQGLLGSAVAPWAFHSGGVVFGHPA
jgi:hypothetical protein